MFTKYLQKYDGFLCFSRVKKLHTAPLILVIHFFVLFMEVHFEVHSQ